jgi:peptide-methionine (S)-S-oxide reductase
MIVQARSAFLTALVALVPFALAPVGALAAPPPAAHTETAVLAGGCFWGLEDVFSKLRGVKNVVVGYAGGSAATAHYEIVSTGVTGHAESVQITYDPAQVSYAQLLDVFFAVAHDPTEKDRQGPDDGHQYRSSIFFMTPQQQQVAMTYVHGDAAATKQYRGRIVTEVVPFTTFYAAEDYHQHYAERNPTNPYIVYNDAPKVVALRERYPALLKVVAKN